MNHHQGDSSTEVFRPAIRSFWFLFFGLALGPAIIFFEHDPEGRLGPWIFLSLACLALIVHRLSLKYTLDGQTLRAESWWGLGRPERVTLAQLAEVRPAQGFPGRLVGCGHLEVRSWAPDEPSLVILGQPDYLELAGRIEARAREARVGSADG